MKPVYFITLVVLLAVCHGCESARPLQNDDQQDLVTIITVDCRNEPAVTNLVKQLLRMVRVSEWEVRDNGDFEDIEARYREISPRQVVDIEERLKQYPGVLNVEIKRERMLLRKP